MLRNRKARTTKCSIESLCGIIGVFYWIVLMFATTSIYFWGENVMKNEVYTNGMKYASICIIQVISELLQVRIIEPTRIDAYELFLVI